MAFEFINRQFRKPGGLLGMVIGKAMGKFNRPVYQRALELLELQNGDSVLEIGFGTGELLNMVLERQAGVTATGIDFSPLMVKRCAVRNAKFIAEGRLSLVKGDFVRDRFELPAINKVCFCNTIYFWDELKSPFSCIYELMSPGKGVLFMNDDEELTRQGLGKSSVFKARSVGQVSSALGEAGFTNIEVSEFTFVEHGYFIEFRKS